jgi:hypothetical protein
VRGEEEGMVSDIGAWHGHDLVNVVMVLWCNDQGLVQESKGYNDYHQKSLV